MGELAKKAMNNQRRSDLPRDDGLSPEEQRAFKKLQAEAREAGSYLASGGKGGLPPSTVLGVMRRDKFRCKRCGELGDKKKNGGIGVHHKSEHLENPKAKRRSALLGKQDRIDDRSNIVTLCDKDHDEVHKEDRAEYGDAEQRKHPERH